MYIFCSPILISDRDKIKEFLIPVIFPLEISREFMYTNSRIGYKHRQTEIYGFWV